MKKGLLLALAALVYLTSNAQQDPQWTMWFNDKMSFNPATAGLDDAHCVSLFHRDQWDGLNGDPKTTMFNYSGRFHPNVGLGLTFFSDRLGPETNTVFRAHGAFRLNPLSNGANLSFGLAVGMYGKKLGNDWIARDPVNDDNAIPNNELSESTLDLNLGVYYEMPGKYYIGASATHLSQGELANVGFTQSRHYYFMGGYNFDAGSGVLRTNLLAKSDFKASIVDLNFNYLMNDVLYVGASFRPMDAIAPMIGLEYCTSKQDKTTKQNYCFRLGYSYDVTLSDLKEYSSGSHEMFLSLCYNIISIPQMNRHANPRFL